MSSKWSWENLNYELENTKLSVGKGYIDGVHYEGTRLFAVVYFVYACSDEVEKIYMP